MIRWQPRIFRLAADGTMVKDDSGWTLSLFGDRIWLARFGQAWRALYPSTWLFGLGQSRRHGRRMWFYFPARWKG